MFTSAYICILVMSRRKHTILYIHGMGGGADSRIPGILHDHFSSSSADADIVQVVCRTYSFDPDVAHRQIVSWVEECAPSLIVGESLGSLHALRVYGVPVILISPALNTPFYFNILSYLTWIPGVSRLLASIYKPREGDRQVMTFTRSVLNNYRSHGRTALEFYNHSDSPVHAFFGVRDHYRRTGVVSVRKWKKVFGQTYSIYDGTHFMEEEYIYSLLIPEICGILSL